MLDQPSPKTPCSAEEQLASDEDVLALSKRYIDKNREVYLELAKGTPSN